ncbi:dUTP diphosphatase [Tumebacillus permanentifrigoris]|uniref:Dimeric dUTPase (All-alpha-NTP-PPase superfamily) n=1 Tax=Tumebacillus permanentifrigoris TaxID=378543 RepID=A0A316D237_9BACL|nr:dUTP diphosphatase [Tumebacillus permanentifrigoris]PWK03951.1 dimeric dUTPase (all-alpha-NTP-PPase superfamily) [Tumebacillus permanentifrigoris]
MNLTTMFEATRQHDAALIEKNNLTGDLLSRKVLALQVALGRVADLAGIGGWSTTAKPSTDVKLLCHICSGKGTIIGLNWEEATCEDCVAGVIGHTNPLLEAYTKALGIVISIGVSIDHEIYSYFHIDCGTIEEQILETMRRATEVYRDGEEASLSYEELFEHITYLGEVLGFTEEQIETAYLESIERQRAAIG